MRYRPRLFNTESVAIIVACALLAALLLCYLSAPLWEPAAFLALSQ